MTRVAQGRAYKQIAIELSITYSTVRGHVYTTFTKLGLTNRCASAAVVIMIERGWVGALPRPADPPLPPLSPTHLAYTWAFTRLVLERTVLCVNIVTVAFMLLCLDTGFKPEGPRNVPDIDPLLLRIGRGVCRPVYFGLDNDDY